MASAFWYFPSVRQGVIAFKIPSKSFFHPSVIYTLCHNLPATTSRIRTLNWRTGRRHYLNRVQIPQIRTQIQQLIANDSKTLQPKRRIPWGSGSYTKKKLLLRIRHWWRRATVALIRYSIFAGLFSAVLSAFLIEARKDLKPDPQATTNALFQALLESQGGSSTTFDPPPFKVTTSARFVNGLRFCSLFFSLASALGASLAKSWIAEYAQVKFKSNVEDAYRRHLRFIGISRWRLIDVIMFLPILLHIAFFLFAFGLAILLFVDDRVIGVVILVLTSVAFTLYFSAAVVPAFYPDCPYQTPVTTFLVGIASRLFNATRPLLPASHRDACRAQMLLWLLSACDDNADINRIVISIAELSSSQDVQKLLFNTELLKTLWGRLSYKDVQSDPQVLRSHFIVIWRTGFPLLQRTSELDVIKVALEYVTEESNRPLFEDMADLTDCIQKLIACVYRWDNPGNFNTVLKKLARMFNGNTSDGEHNLDTILWMLLLANQISRARLGELHFLGLQSRTEINIPQSVP